MALPCWNWGVPETCMVHVHRTDDALPMRVTKKGKDHYAAPIREAGVEMVAKKS